MPMTQVPSYIGDDAFKAFLSEHGCRTSFEEIRMRFLGAMVSPGRDADIYLLVEDLFEHDMPELADGSASEAFLHTFLGLWNVVAESSGKAQSPCRRSGLSPPVGRSKTFSTVGSTRWCSASWKGSGVTTTNFR